MDTLAVGFRYRRLQDLADVVKNEEVQNDGQFELERSVLSTFIKFKCNREQSNDGNDQGESEQHCEAYITAEKRMLGKQTWFVIVERNLNHVHFVTNKEQQASCSTSASHQTSISIDPSSTLYQILGIEGQPLNLQRFLFHRGKNGYNCRFCSIFVSKSYALAAKHVQAKHENDGVWFQKKIYFVPCYAYCRKNYIRKTPLLHYHCYCGVLLHSKSALMSHLRSRKCYETIGEALHSSVGDQRGAIPASLNGISHRRSVNDCDDTVKFFKNPEELNHKVRRPTSDYGTTEASEIPVKKCKFSLRTDAVSPLGLQQQQQQLDKLDCLMRKIYENCKVCGQNFDSLTDLLRHDCLVSSSKTTCPDDDDDNLTPKNPGANLICPLCEKRLKAVDGLATHYLDNHARLFGPALVERLKVEHCEFSSASAFFTWKSDLEISTNAYFSRKRRLTESDGGTTLFFACCFSWADSRTRLKEKKTERRCPAFIKVSQTNESALLGVSYCTFHYGHDLNRIKFWKQVRKSLHGLLSFRHKRPFESTLGVSTIDHTEATNEGAVEQRLSDKPQSTTVPTSNEKQTILPEATAPISLAVPISTTVQNIDLDQFTDFYWDVMRRRLNESGIFPPSVEGRWINVDSFVDQDEKVCRICKAEFKNRRSMVRHILRVHDPNRANRATSKYSASVRCFFCNMEMTQPPMKNLIHHYINAHDQQLKLKLRIFENAGSFTEWLQMVTASMFKRHKFYKSAKGDYRQYWACKHSGKLQNPEAAVTKGHCPAWIFAEVLQKGPVRVSYCLYHLGHEINENSKNLVTADTTVDSYDQLASTINPIHSSEPILAGLSASAGDSDSNSNTVVYGTLFNNGNAFCEPIGASNTGGYILEFNDESTLTRPNFYLPDNNTLQHMMMPSGSDAGISMEVTIESANSPSQGAAPSVVPGTSISFVDTVKTGSGAIPLAYCEFNGQKSAEIRNQFSVTVRCATGERKLVKIPLVDFPLVTDQEGHKYYALEENFLINCVSQILTKSGDQLRDGDQLEII